MENAVDALKMAAAVLIFIIAIGTSFSLFGTAKRTADFIITSRNKQKYLEAAELDTVLYTSSESIKNTGSDDVWSGTGITKNGDRIVSIADVFSTIYRYSKEKYGVTIMQSDGTVLARYDSATESIIRNWYNIKAGEDSSGNTVPAEQQKEKYVEKIKKNLANAYVGDIKLPVERLEEIYTVNTSSGTSKVDAPWYGNDEEIEKRINADISGTEYTYNNKTYIGKNLFSSRIIPGTSRRIIEVTNEIDNSKYLEDTTGQTNLLQQYKMSTVEIIYIVIN